MRFDYKALGRLPRGVMNKTETGYSLWLERQKQAGEILWYKFDCLNLRLADKTFYKPDFLVLPKSLELEFHEVKGFMTDDANVKIKVVAETFPLFKFKIVKLVRNQWELTEV